MKTKQKGGWGWVVLFCAALSQCVCYGLLMAFGILMGTVTRRYATVTFITQQQQQQQQLLVKPFISSSSSSLSSSSLDAGILAHYRPIYLSATPINYPTPITGPVAGQTPPFIYYFNHLIRVLGYFNWLLTYWFCEVNCAFFEMVHVGPVGRVLIFVR